MVLVWSFVGMFVVALLLFGYFLDKKTNRYKRISDKNAKDSQELMKDEAQKHNPPNSNHTNWW
ncbi:hypothetical protein [Cytobacillus gottheilii]|uniref:Uncharacterized protein n=1 Tax=Cytobacillus gottheilii TaxID=859144 RepID=A0ABX8FHH7_9BACI|nr:hypothetical protein [Cytobacillus gottheilii]QVY63449.1 hypothetical protein J1899_10540 [Cytobacillus gottheilii]